jgi:transcriptional regulator with XRE-family HTH domain
LQNDKVGSPQANTVHRIAEFLECSPVWLETGIGEMFDEEECQETEYIPTSKRLAYLKGNMTLKAFAQKCGIAEEILAKYLEDGRITNNEHIDTIAKKFNTSIGWLTAGEGWQSPNKKYTGFTLGKHMELGEKLYEISQIIDRLEIDLCFSYPLEGRLSRPRRDAIDCQSALRSLQGHLEENFYSDDRENFSTSVYYGVKERLKKKEKLLQAQKETVPEEQKHEPLQTFKQACFTRLDHYLEYIAEKHGTESMNIEFLMKDFSRFFSEQYPGYNVWLDEKRKEKQMEQKVGEEEPNVANGET